MGIALRSSGCKTIMLHQKQEDFPEISDIPNPSMILVCSCQSKQNVESLVLTHVQNIFWVKILNFRFPTHVQNMSHRFPLKFRWSILAFWGMLRAPYTRPTRVGAQDLVSRVYLANFAKVTHKSWESDVGGKITRKECKNTTWLKTQNILILFKIIIFIYCMLFHPY